MNFSAPPSCMEGGFFYLNIENLHYFYSRLLALYTKQNTKMHKIRIIRINILNNLLINICVKISTKRNSMRIFNKIAC